MSSGSSRRAWCSIRSRSCGSWRATRFVTAGRSSPSFRGRGRSFARREILVTDADRHSLEQRVLVLAPTGKDAALTRSVLDRAGVACVCCPDMLPRVFELFTQIERHADRAQGGLGIGLTLVK